MAGTYPMGTFRVYIRRPSHRWPSILVHEDGAKASQRRGQARQASFGTLASLKSTDAPLDCLTVYQDTLTSPPVQSSPSPEPATRPAIRSHAGGLGTWRATVDDQYVMGWARCEG